MHIIGITGGVGCGKSTVLDILDRICCCRILKADDVANRLKEPGEACYEPITGLFARLGKNILAPDGRIDNRLMAEAVFGDEQLLGKVNSIIHPQVKKYVLHKIDLAKADNIDFFFLEAALLIEDGYLSIVDEMWYIYADEAVRRRRLKTSRGYSDEKIDSIMCNQLSEEEFRGSCSLVLDNNGDADSLESAIRGIISGRA